MPCGSEPAVAGTKLEPTKADQALAFGGLVGMGVFVVYTGVRFVRDTLEAIRPRERMPWDVEE